MSLIFADTSALAKRYVHEAGSAWVRSWAAVEAGNQIVVSELIGAEMVSLLARRWRTRGVSLASFTRLRDAFLLHLEQEYLVVPLRSDILTAAADLVVRHPLRTLDAIHLASAGQVMRQLGATPLFVCADQRLLTAAAAEGFPGDDPNAH